MAQVCSTSPDTIASVSSPGEIPCATDGATPRLHYRRSRRHNNQPITVLHGYGRTCRFCVEKRVPLVVIGVPLPKAECVTRPSAFEKMISLLPAPALPVQRLLPRVPVIVRSAPARAQLGVAGDGVCSNRTGMSTRLREGPTAVAGTAQRRATGGDLSRLMSGPAFVRLGWERRRGRRQRRPRHHMTNLYTNTATGLREHQQDLSREESTPR